MTNTTTIKETHSIDWWILTVETKLKLLENSNSDIIPNL